MHETHAIGLLAALLAGLAGNAHCFAMCGGIASALGLHAQRQGSTSFATAALYQAGRLSGYTLAGALCGFIGSQASVLLDFMKLGPILRTLSGVLIVLLGLRLLSRWNALQWLEQLGAKLWARLRPLVQLAGTRTGIAKPLTLGLLWSLLPCGLVYSMLLFAAMSADVLRGALIMFAFGCGTLPSMLSMSLVGAQLRTYLTRPSVRYASGALMLAFGVWMIVAATQMAGGHVH
jgi:sulfite exporter TauE/SafE